MVLTVPSEGALPSSPASAPDMVTYSCVSQTSVIPACFHTYCHISVLYVPSFFKSTLNWFAIQNLTEQKNSCTQVFEVIVTPPPILGEEMLSYYASELNLVPSSTHDTHATLAKASLPPGCSEMGWWLTRDRHTEIREVWASENLTAQPSPAQPSRTSRDGFGRLGHGPETWSGTGTPGGP